MNKPNVILLTIDTLRADRLGCYGRQPSPTPNLDRLAESGICFTQAITGGSWTQAAFPVLLTSSYASMYGGCLGVLNPARPAPIRTMAEHGYTTAGFSTSPLLGRDYGYDRDFDHFFELFPEEVDPALRNIKGGQRLLRQPLIHHLARLLNIQTRPAKLYAEASRVTDDVVNWIARSKTPFFVWTHYMDVHWPYHLEDELKKPADIAQAWRDLAHMHTSLSSGSTTASVNMERYTKLYEEAVTYTDQQIGRLLNYMSDAHLFDNTVLVVVADHGEEFLEHGRWGHWEDNLYDEILKVPLIMRLPSQYGNLVIREQVRTLDIMPTILDLCGLPCPEAVEGTSLTPLWRDCSILSRDEVNISEMPREDWHLIAIRCEDFKYIWNSRAPAESKLFNLKNDPGETHNIVADCPEVADKLHVFVEEQLYRLTITSPTQQPNGPQLSREVVERLRGLGYMD